MNAPDYGPVGGIAGDIPAAGLTRAKTGKQTSFDATNTKTGQLSALPSPSSPALGTSVVGAPVSRGIGDLTPANIQSAARRAAGIPERPATVDPLPGISTPPQSRQAAVVPQQAGNGWSKTGIGADRAGGEIVGRMGANGVPEFSNNATAQQGAGPQRAVGRVGDGVGGGLTVGAPGDSRMAIDRFEAANAERAQTIDMLKRYEPSGVRGITAGLSDDPITARRQIREAEIRQGDERLAAGREEIRQRGIEAGMDRALRERELANVEANGALDRQIKEQAVASGIPALEQQAKRIELQGKLAANELLGKLQDPNLSADERTAYERQYLLTTNPGAYAKAQATVGRNTKLTEQQSKDLVYFNRGNEANAQLAQQGDALTGRASGERGAVRGVVDSMIRGTPLVGDSSVANTLVSAERQQAEQSGRELLASILRKDTGAAITKNEFQIYGRMYLPQPGDSDEVLNQKAEARTRALESIRGGLGNAQQLAAPVADGSRQGAEKSAAAAPVRVTSLADVERLPSGSVFIGPDGVQRRKP